MVTLEVLKEVLLTNSQPGTRQRRGYAIAYGRLADFAGLDGKELRRLSTYSSLNSVKSRNLPSDEVIFEVGQNIENPRWRNAYWLMAVYGLRDHELWRCDLTRLKDTSIYSKDEGTDRDITNECLVFFTLKILGFIDFFRY